MPSPGQGPDLRGRDASRVPPAPSAPSPSAVSWQVTAVRPPGPAPGAPFGAFPPAPVAPVAAPAPAGAVDPVSGATAPAPGAEQPLADPAAGAEGQARSRARARAVAAGQAAAVARGADQPLASAAALAARTPAVPPRRPEQGPPSGPGRPRPRPRAGVIAGIHLGQLLLWELVLLLAVVLHREPWPVLVAVGVPALVLLLLTAVRRRGRWLYEWAGVWLRSRVRRRVVPLAGESGPAAALLDAVSTGAMLGSLDVDGEQVALVDHAGGLTAVLEVRLGPVPESRGESGPLPPLSLLLPAADEESDVAVQVVVHSVPAPLSSVGEDPAALSYRELTGGTVPARRRCWVALQVQRTPEQVPSAEQRALLVSSLQRVQRRLRKSGCTGVLLSPDRLAVDLLELADADAGAPPVREAWRTWSAGGRAQTSWRFLDWPRLADPRSERFVEDLLGAPAASTTLSIAARRIGGEDIEVEAAFRAGLGPAQLRDVDRAVSGLARGHGARLRRLDGEQVVGVAGTLPLGGFLR